MTDFEKAIALVEFRVDLILNTMDMSAEKPTRLDELQVIRLCLRRIQNGEPIGIEETPG